MTQTILKENEFIISLKYEDLLKVIFGEEQPKIELTNPHKESYDYNSLQVLQLLFKKLNNEE